MGVNILNDVKRPKQISVTYTDELDRIISDIRQKLIDLDTVKYGKKFVDTELKKKRGSRYSNESIIKMLVRAGYDVMKDDLQVKYTRARVEKGEHDNNIIVQMLLENERKRINGSASVFNLDLF